MWTHVGLVYAKGEKMSNSLGNTVAARDMVRDYGANAMRLYMYGTHYRKRLDFIEKELKKCTELDGMIGNALRGKKKTRHMTKFLQALGNDFDTPKAIKTMAEAAEAKSADLRTMAGILGLRY
jgi:cysteinyl-tRNA synthetase